MADSRQTELSQVADWAAHNGWYRIIDAAVAELADNHLEYAGDRSDFVNLISLISACDYDDSNSFADLLTAFARIKKVSKPDESEENKWNDIKKDIIYQLVVSKLRQSLFLTNDASADEVNFDDPNIDIDQYRQSVVETFDELNLYSGPKKQRVYDVDVDSVTTVLFVKGHRKAFAKRKVQMFLEANETETFQRNTLDFVRDLLNDKFPTPTLTFSDPSAEAHVQPAPSASSNKRKHSLSSGGGLGENLTYAAVTSDDFMDSVAGSVKVVKKAKTAPASTITPTPTKATPSKTAGAAAVAVPSSTSKALVTNYKHASQEFKSKYDKTDPLKVILKAAKQLDSHSSSSSAAAPAADTNARANPTTRRAQAAVRSVSADSVGVMNIEDDSEEEEEEEVVVRRPVAGSAVKAAASYTPTASSTLNRLKNVLDETQHKKFPTKLDSSPVPAATSSNGRRSTKSAPADVTAGYTSAPVVAGPMRTGWTDEETKAFLAGVAVHGFGNWKEILDDNRFGPVLINRTNVNLKDRYRTLEKKGLL